MVSPTFQDPAMVPFPDSGFSDKNINHAGIPLWIQEQVSFPCYYVEDSDKTAILQGLADIGFPLNGSDGVFINIPTGFMAIPEAC